MKIPIGLIEALKSIRKARNAYSTKTLNRDNIMKALIDKGYTIVLGNTPHSCLATLLDLEKSSWLHYMLVMCGQIRTSVLQNLS